MSDIPSVGDFLDIIAGYAEEPSHYHKHEVVKFGVVDPSYSSGRPRITFDGETVMSTKQYPYLKHYSPGKNHRVLLLRVSNTYVIIGEIV